MTVLTHPSIRDVPWASRSSNSPGLQVNSDGSVDLYFAPKPLDGQQTHWVPTKADSRFEAPGGLYGDSVPASRFSVIAGITT